MNAGRLLGVASPQHHRTAAIAHACRAGTASASLCTLRKVLPLPSTGIRGRVSPSSTAPGVSTVRAVHHFHRPRIQSSYLTSSASPSLRSAVHIRYQSTTASPTPTPPPSPADPNLPSGQHTSQAQTPPPSRLGRILTTSSLFAACLLAGFVMSAAPALDTLNGFRAPPSDAETLTLFEPATPEQAHINEHILTHPLAAKLRAQPGWSESRPHLKIPPAMRPHNLTGGTLLGADKIEVPPLTFSQKEQTGEGEGETDGEGAGAGVAFLPGLVQISFLGPALCGHPGIVHGGLLATMLDEGLARACFPALPNKVGVTASLKIDYRVPCPASSYVALKAQTTKVEGRKAWVKGWIELLGEGDGEGTKLVEAEALFIEPKNAKHMARVYSSQ